MTTLNSTDFAPERWVTAPTSCRSSEDTRSKLSFETSSLHLRLAFTYAS